MTNPLDVIVARAKAQLEPKPYAYPGTTAPIRVRLLPEGVIDDAKLEAQDYVKKRKADLSIDPEFFDREVQRQIVWKSVLRVDPDEDGQAVQLYPTDADVRALDSVTLEALWRLYLEHQETCSTMRQLAQDEVDELAKSARLSPSSLRIQLSQIDHASLVRITMSVLARPPAEPDAT